jgi:WD40 repeat protein
MTKGSLTLVLGFLALATLGFLAVKSAFAPQNESKEEAIKQNQPEIAVQEALKPKAPQEPEIPQQPQTPKHRINEVSLQQIQRGMTLEEVEEILGVPAGDYTKNQSQGYLINEVRQLRVGKGRVPASQYMIWTSPDFGIFVVFTNPTTVKFNGTVVSAEQIPFVGVLPIFPGQEPQPPGGIVLQNPPISYPEPELSSLADATLGNRVRSMRTLAYSPDSKYLVTSHSDNHINSPALVLVWDIDQGKPKYILEGHKIAVLAAAFSPDGSLLATGGQCNNLYFWDMATGKKIGNGYSHANRVHSLAFSPDGKYLASSSAGIRLWDTKTLKETNLVKNETNELTFAVDFSPDGKRIIVGFQSTERSYDLETGRWINEQLPRAAWEKRNLLALGGTDGSIQLWSNSEGKVVRNLLDPPQPVFDLRFIGDKKLVSLTEDAVLHTWDRTTFKEGQRGKLLLPPDELLAAWSPEGNHLVTSSRKGTLRLWQTDSGNLLWQKTNILAYLPMPRPRINNPGSLSEPALLLSSQGAEFSTIFGHRGLLPNEPVVFSADSNFLASTVKSGAVAVWETITGKELNQVQVPFPVKCLALSQKYLVCEIPDSESTIHLFHWASGKELKNISLPHHPEENHKGYGNPAQEVDSFHFSPDGQWLAVVEKIAFRKGGIRPTIKVARQVHLLKIDDEGKNMTLPGFTGNTAAFSPDGKLLAYYLSSSSIDSNNINQLAIWDLDRGELSRTSIDRNRSPIFQGLVFSPDNRTLAAKSGTIIFLWDVAKRFEKNNLGRNGNIQGSFGEKAPPN